MVTFLYACWFLWFVGVLSYIVLLLENVVKTLDDVLAQTTAGQTVIASLITLVTGLKAQLDAAIAANDIGKVQQISDVLGAQYQLIAEAVVANTPAATPPTN